VRVTADRLGSAREPLATLNAFGRGPTAEETLRATFDLAAVGIAHVAPDGRFLRVNQKLCDIFGLARDELLQCRFQDLTHPTDIAPDLNRLGRLLAGEISSFTMEKRYIRKDGKLIWADLSVSLVRDEAGRPSYCISVVVDITERKLAQEALRESEARAEAANRAKSAFLAAMSHEIRTPMSGIIGFADLLRQTSLNQQQHRFAKALSDSASALLTIIDDILDFSKLEARRVTIRRVDFDPQQLIDSTLSLLAPTAQTKGLKIETTPDFDLPRLLNGDPGRLRQVLLNLVGNAIKFTERGHVRVTASHRDLRDDRLELRIEVTDSGIGIPTDARAMLFARFSQVDSTTQRVYGGTGLGLAISKELCELMGGTVGYESEQGKGSRFWFVVVCDIPCAKTLKHWPESEASKEKAVRSLDVLVVEDHELVRMMIAEMVAELGHHAELACNGKEAVAAVQARQYDLVLMDAQMPTMDGVAATKAIRALESPANAVPIVALTAHAIEGYRDVCVAAGMNDYLSKPVKLEALNTLLARWSACAS
jgi:two-component system, sensor histidine kinase and response regulator